MEVAQKTLYVITQLGKQDVEGSLSSCFGTNDRMLRYKRRNYLFYTDTFFGKKVISMLWFSMTQLFENGKGLLKVYGMKSEKEFLSYSEIIL